MLSCCSMEFAGLAGQFLPGRQLPVNRIMKLVVVCVVCIFYCCCCCCCFCYYYYYYHHHHQVLLIQNLVCSKCITKKGKSKTLLTIINYDHFSDLDRAIGAICASCVDNNF